MRAASAWLCGVVAACTWACQRAEQGGGKAPVAPVAPPPTWEAPAAAADALPSVDNITWAAQRAWCAQVKATPDQAEAHRLTRALRARGVVAHAQRADLGERGIWHRVLVGAWARRDELDGRAARIMARPDVVEILGAPAPGEAAFVPLEVPFPGTPSPALVSALRGLATAPRSVLPLATPAGVGALAWSPDAMEVVALDVDGTGSKALQVPAPTCDGCMPGALQVLSVEPAASGGSARWLVSTGPEDARAVTWLQLDERGAFSVLASVPTRLKAPGALVLADVALRQLDTDEDLELLHHGARLVLGPDGAACDATPVFGAVDVERGRARPMDRALHVANGVARRQGGGDEVKAFVAGTMERAPEMALDAALAYLAHAPDDAEMFGTMVQHAEAWGKDGRKALQLRALSGLAAGHAQWRVGLAPRLTDVLAGAVAYVGAGRREACASPLLSAAAAQKLRPDAREALNALFRRPDPSRLEAGDLAALMVAYEKGSPPAQAVDALVNAMEGTELLVRARAALAERRATAAPPADARGAQPPPGLERAPAP